MAELVELRNLDQSLWPELKEAIEEQAKWTAKSATCIFTNCSHYIKLDQVIQRGHPGKNYNHELEWECPICSKPVMLKMPIYCHEVRSALESYPTENICQELSSFDGFLHSTLAFVESFQPNKFLEKSVYPESYHGLFREELIKGGEMFKKILNFISDKNLSIKLPPTVNFYCVPLAVVSSWVKNLLDYLPVTDLQTAAKKFARCYSSLLIYDRLHLTSSVTAEQEQPGFNQCDDFMDGSCRRLVVVLARALQEDQVMLPDLYSLAVAELVGLSY